MKPWIKIFIGALIGFGGGFASGFFVHKKLNDVKFQEVSEEEMAEIEAAALKKEDEKKDIPEKKENEVKEVELPEDPDEIKKTLQGKTSYIKADAEQKRAYEKMWKATAEYSSRENADQIPIEKIDEEEMAPIEEDFDEDFLESIEREAEEAGNNFVDPPHTISLVEFYNERNEFDKITIDWYEPDNVWLDEREEIIPDIQSYIGMDGKKLFNDIGADEDPDVRFIRNDRYGTDYEIIRHHRSYAETIGGVDK